MMDACAQPGLLPVHEAISRMLGRLTPVAGTELVPLVESLDRVLAQDVIAPINVPGGDNSAMDGYAVRHQDCAAELTVIGESFAGHPFSSPSFPEPMNAGQAVRIMTGALVPAGADAVVMQENVTRTGNAIRINKLPVAGENIRRAGEDIAVQSLVLQQGRLLTALDIGLLASLGIDQVNVFQRIKIAVLTTGDELLAPGAPYQAGLIYDSNRPLLNALLQRLPVELLDLGIVPDNPEALRKAFVAARDYADLVISTGGVSVGDADYTKDILADLGEINFWKIAMKPGKPFAFGVLGKNARNTGCWFCGLPGNPVSTAVTYHQLVVPALRYLAGERIVEAQIFQEKMSQEKVAQEKTIQEEIVQEKLVREKLVREKLVQEVIVTAIASKPLKKQPGRMDFQRGIFSCIDGINRVETAGSQSSGVLSSMGKANCYIRLEAERGAVAAGEKVDVILFDQFIR